MKRLTSSVAAFGMAGVLLLSGHSLAAPGAHVVSAASAASAAGGPVAESALGANSPKAQKYRKAAQRATNEARVANERVEVQGDACLRKAARSYIKRMAKAGGLVPHNLKAVAKRCDMGVVKENIGVGFSSGKKLVGAWMAIEESRTVLLRKKARHGVVEAIKKDGDWYAIQLLGNG